MRGTVEQRFWAKVDKHGPVPGPRPELGPCWIWQPQPGSSGYGNVSWNGRSVRTYWLAYTWLVGPVSEGLELDHLCRNRRCVNPAHLEPVTHQVNVLRGASVAATCARQTHCIHGHPFDAANTRYAPEGRVCRACRAAVRRQQYERRLQTAGRSPARPRRYARRQDDAA